MKWFIKGIRNYAVIRGRASRQEFWMFLLFFVIFVIMAMLLTELTGRLFGFEDLFVLLMLVPVNAIVIRRLHDVGKSGWWYIRWAFFTIFVLSIAGTTGFFMSRLFEGDFGTTFLAILGLLSLSCFIVACLRLLVLLCKPGTPTLNKYGPYQEETASEDPDKRES